jgi:hypothetical protein
VKIGACGMGIWWRNVFLPISIEDAIIRAVTCLLGTKHWLIVIPRSDCIGLSRFWLQHCLSSCSSVFRWSLRVWQCISQAKPPILGQSPIVGSTRTIAWKQGKPNQSKSNRISCRIECFHSYQTKLYANWIQWFRRFDPNRNLIFDFSFQPKMCW